ncbi:MAG: hypothetical protein WC552_09255 [Candidatus Omnitrophota bacterium]
MINKCPYCFEEISGRPLKCPHCLQYLIDEPLTVEFHSLDKKPCLFCGKKILAEAKICKHCQRWLDEVDRAADDLDNYDV